MGLSAAYIAAVVPVGMGTHVCWREPLKLCRTVKRLSLILCKGTRLGPSLPFTTYLFIAARSRDHDPNS